MKRLTTKKSNHTFYLDDDIFKKYADRCAKDAKMMSPTLDIIIYNFLFDMENEDKMVPIRKARQLLEDEAKKNHDTVPGERRRLKNLELQNKELEIQKEENHNVN